MNAVFDPPADPYGDEKHCRICDKPMTWNWISREWECTSDHDEVPPLVDFLLNPKEGEA